MLLADPDRAAVLSLQIIARVEVESLAATMTLHRHRLVHGLLADGTQR